LIAISLLIIFIYGSIIWGVFPIEKTISWEGHLMGLIWGFILSIFFLPEGPQNIPHPINNDLTHLEEKFGKEYWMNHEMNKMSTDTNQNNPESNSVPQQLSIPPTNNISSTQKNIQSIQYTLIIKSEESKKDTHSNLD
jgi:hypothetical protein